ncbi:conserved hypothetical protein [Theileria orientalis strain Shintoku]|uniref:Uncharacterized protein n=1 Tax=Theileria orientalis strain Shintoku TaxID=869250 RepID=J4CCY4_THEOR|nr:conserved hypothetical protein [Theileria orientalis strain Shintoku]BAM40197.1 conserved hypothetical protein [Theileria orientalis strain Shintoku]|eukprot:XP_009690498.1 conserved hypothetical protein [Theileria orientalis strain Shintoku]
MSLSYERYQGCSPVYSDFIGYKGDVISDTNLNFSENSNDLSNKVRSSLGHMAACEDERLAELAMNLERERETYLEAVAVLHEQLRESHAQCQHLVDSHAELTRELEAEADDGWQEAKLWQRKYLTTCKILKSSGIKVPDVSNLATVDSVSIVSSPNMANLTVVQNRDDKAAAPEQNAYVSENVYGSDSQMTSAENAYGSAENVYGVNGSGSGKKIKTIGKTDDLPLENYGGTWVYTLSDNFEDLENLNFQNLPVFPMAGAGGKNRDCPKSVWINLKTPRRFSCQRVDYVRDNSYEPLNKTLELLKYVDY